MMRLVEKSGDGNRNPDYIDRTWNDDSSDDHRNDRELQSVQYRHSIMKARWHLGATHERSIFRVVIPAAKSGVIAGVVLGIGRAIGETMAVIMVAGNQPRLPEVIFYWVCEP